MSVCADGNTVKTEISFRNQGSRISVLFSLLAFCESAHAGCTMQMKKMYFRILNICRPESVAVLAWHVSADVVGKTLES